jgi:hypothetical protein
MLRPGVFVLKMHMDFQRSHCFALSCLAGDCDHEVVLLFPTFSPLGICSTMTSLLYFRFCPSHLLGIESDAYARRCCAVQFSAMGSGRLYHLFWLKLGMRLGEAFL